MVKRQQYRVECLFYGDLIYHKVLGKATVRRNWYGDRDEPILVVANGQNLAFERKEIMTEKEKARNDERDQYPFVVYNFTYEWLKSKMSLFEVSKEQARTMIYMLKAGRYDRIVSAFNFLKKKGIPIFMYKTSAFDGKGGRGEVVVLTTVDAGQIAEMVGRDGGHLTVPKSPFSFDA